MLVRLGALVVLMLIASGGDAAPISILPQGIQQTLVVRAVGSALSKQLPLRLDSGAAFPTVDTLPGEPFAGKPLRVTAANLRQVLPPGDYLIAVTAYCTQYSVHRPGGGVAYKVAPIQGSEADALSALLWRGAIRAVPYSELQAVEWSMQGGLTYSEMPSSYQRTVDMLIPDLKGQLKDDFVQNVERVYQKIAGTNSNIPPLDALLAKMGTPGELLLSAKRQREIILSSYRNDEIRNQRLFDGQANVWRSVPAESGPWTVAIPGVAYERFKVIEGWQGRNVGTRVPSAVHVVRPYAVSDALPKRMDRVQGVEVVVARPAACHGFGLAAADTGVGRMPALRRSAQSRTCSSLGSALRRS